MLYGRKQIMLQAAQLPAGNAENQQAAFIRPFIQVRQEKTLDSAKWNDNCHRLTASTAGIAIIRSLTYTSRYRPRILRSIIIRTH